MNASANNKRSSGLGREVFDQSLARHGIVLTPDEAESVFALAQWMDDGVAGLDPLDVSPEASFDPSQLSIGEAGRHLRAGSLTAVALLDAHLARIVRVDGVYHAFYVVLADTARAAAVRADAELAAGLDRGPLHGIPVGIKDLIDVVGVATTAGSRGRAGAVASHNALVVDRLIEGGAVIVGKLATYEWATVGPAFDTLFPPSRNPWNIEHITGGSSSGPAVAVAGGMLRTTIGSDTGGSVRGPASYCGVVGLKPTYALVPATGSIELAPSLDHLGPMSATTAEAALTLDVIAGQAGLGGAASLLGVEIAGLRIAYARDWFALDPQASPDVVAAMDAAVSELSLLGARIEEIDMPDYQPLEAVGAAILHKEAFALHADRLASDPTAYGRKSYQTLASGISLTDEHYERAKQAGRAFKEFLDHEVFSRFDALVTVCALTTALPLSMFGKGAVWTPMRTIGFNVSGHPVLALPIGLSGGLPMGMQIVGKHFAEARICQIGDAFERVTAHYDRQPPDLA